MSQPLGVGAKVNNKEFLVEQPKALHQGVQPQVLVGKALKAMPLEQE